MQDDFIPVRDLEATAALHYHATQHSSSGNSSSKGPDTFISKLLHGGHEQGGGGEGRIVPGVKYPLQLVRGVQVAWSYWVSLTWPWPL